MVQAAVLTGRAAVALRAILAGISAAREIDAARREVVKLQKSGNTRAAATLRVACDRAEVELNRRLRARNRRTQRAKRAPRTTSGQFTVR